MQTINVSITFNPDDEKEFEDIIFYFSESKVNFLKWVHLMCAGTMWEAAYVLANEFIQTEEDLNRFFKSDYFSGSPNADDIFNDLMRFVDDNYVLH
jgi:hypothetical protein